MASFLPKVHVLTAWAFEEVHEETKVSNHFHRRPLFHSLLTSAASFPFSMHGIFIRGVAPRNPGSPPKCGEFCSVDAMLCGKV